MRHPRPSPGLPGTDDPAGMGDGLPEGGRPLQPIGYTLLPVVFALTCWFLLPRARFRRPTAQFALDAGEEARGRGERDRRGGGRGCRRRGGRAGCACGWPWGRDRPRASGR